MLNNDLDSLKVGDKALVVHSGGWNTTINLVTIEKVLKLYVVANGHKYRKRGGKAAGYNDRWRIPYLKPFDEKEWVDYQREESFRRMRSYLGNAQWDKVPDNIVHEVYLLVTKKQEAPNEGTSNSSSGDAVRQH